MNVLELKSEFKNQLSDRYTTSEVGVIFSVFLEKKMGLNSIQQKIFQDKELSEKEETEFMDILSELKKGRPYQQILGEVEFFCIPFFVNENVLIPRPETEELLELSIEKIVQRFGDEKINILEIGSGSGVISIVLKKHFPNAEITSLDISEEALQIARKNANFHKVEISFVRENYLEMLCTDSFDVIISNPPYIGKDEFSEIEFSVKNYEPNIALFSPMEDTLIFYRKIAQDVERILKDNGLIFLEINQKLGTETLQLFSNLEAYLLQDLSQNDRFIYAIKN